VRDRVVACAFLFSLTHDTSHRRALSSVYADVEAALTAATKSATTVDTAVAQVNCVRMCRSWCRQYTQVRVQLQADEAARAATLADDTPTSRSSTAGDERLVLSRFLASADLAPLNALCVAGRAHEAALLDHVCMVGGM
jgi:hypothetical protein